MALTILTPDTLRRQVESASKGQNTIHYTAKGQPSYFYVVPSFNDSALSTLHPAFKSASISESTLTNKSEFFFGMYPGTLRNGELLSLPGAAPATNGGLDYFSNLALACNGGSAAGFHLANNIEWGAIQQLCATGGYFPNGNTSNGRSSDNTAEYGVYAATGRTAAAGGTAATTLTGSGPSSWRHNNTPFGIADLCGNVWEWTPGMRLNNYEINVISFDGTTIGNPALFPTSDMVLNSAKWYYIKGVDGTLALATAGTATAGSVRYANAASGAADYTLYFLSTFEGIQNNSTGAQVSAAALNLCKAMGLFPKASYSNGDAFTSLTGECHPIRGGDWSLTSNSGVFALYCNSWRTDSNAHIGARPALIL